MPQYPPILIIGSSGSGKSSALRNLNGETTEILNIERKMLPFRHALKFKHTHMLEDSNAFEAAFTKALTDKSKDTIVIESFTSYVEAVLALSKTINKGYDIYNFLNSKVTSLLHKIKNAQDKWIIMLAIDELVELMNPNGSKTSVRRCEVKGREWEGKVEKEFTVVLFTEVRQLDKTKPATYHFLCNNDGSHSAKSPQGMFPEGSIENDVSLVIARCRAYWELPASLVVTPPSPLMAELKTT